MVDPVELLQTVGQNLSIEEVLLVVIPLLSFIVGVVLYSLFIFKFYKFIGTRDIFPVDLERFSGQRFAFVKKLATSFGSLIFYLIISPLLIFFWFVVFVGFLVFLSKGQSIEIILLMAMTLVASIRIMSYINEEMAYDVAKMIPLAILGLFIIDAGFFNLEASLATLQTIPDYLTIIVYYLGFTILLEFVLRLLTTLVKLVKGK